MTKRYASKFGPNLKNTLDAIAECEAFNAGNLKGDYQSRWLDTGRMSPEVASALRSAIGMDGRFYVVTSYNTPIAWYDGMRWTVESERKYSATTGAHLSVVRRAIA